MGEELHLEGQDSPTLKTFEVTDQKLKFTAVDSLALPLWLLERMLPQILSVESGEGGLQLGYLHSGSPSFQNAL